MKDPNEIYRKIFWATFTVSKNGQKIKDGADFVMWDEIPGSLRNTKTYIPKWPAEVKEIVLFREDPYGGTSMSYCFNNKFLISTEKYSTGEVAFSVKVPQSQCPLCDASAFLPKKSFKATIADYDSKNAKEFFAEFPKTKLFQQFSVNSQEKILAIIKSLGES